MPLEKTPRVLLEIAIVSFLKYNKREATSREILHYLAKRGFKVAPSLPSDLRRVAGICGMMKRKGVLFARSRKDLMFGRRMRVSFWRFNPDFYKDHPKDGMYSEYPLPSPNEHNEFMKRNRKRLKARKKKQHPPHT